MSGSANIDTYTYRERSVKSKTLTYSIGACLEDE